MSLSTAVTRLACVLNPVVFRYPSRSDIYKLLGEWVSAPTEAVRRVYASDYEQECTPAAGQWRSRPVIAALVRLTIALLPIAVAAAVTLTIQVFLLAPALKGHGVWLSIAGYVLLAAATMLVARAVERLGRRALPLVTLLQLSMLFPDQAPSRFQMARTAGNPAALNRLAEKPDEQGAAAAQVLALLTRLSEHERRTRGHSERVRVYADLIGEQLGLPEHDRARLRLAALVHDVGKLTVSADILRKPGRPNSEEWATLQGHPEAGIELAEPLAAWLGPWTGSINEHHERFDGTGYPRRLNGDRISLAGRIVAVADAFETMTANRPYKKQMSVSAARKELTDCAGSHFDPAVVRAFTEISLPRLRRRTLAAGIFLHIPLLGPAQSAVGQLLGLAGPAGTSAMATLTAAAPTSAAVMTVLATSVAVGAVPVAAASGAAAKPSSTAVTAAWHSPTQPANTEQPTPTSTSNPGVVTTATSHHVATSHPKKVTHRSKSTVKQTTPNQSHSTPPTSTSPSHASGQKPPQPPPPHGPKPSAPAPGPKPPEPAHKPPPAPPKPPAALKPPPPPAPAAPAAPKPPAPKPPAPKPPKAK